MLRRLVSAAISLILSLVIGEMLMRTLRPQELSIWAATPTGLAVHLSNVEVWSPRFGHVIRTNQYGMRDIEHSVEKGPGISRVLVLGDSFMEAIQVPFEYSFTSQLGRQLRNLGSQRVEVLNISVSGWGTGDELYWLSEYGAAFEPDLVLVVMTLHNDISDNLEMKHYYLKDGSLTPRTHLKESSATMVTQEVKGFLASHSHLYKFLYNISISARVTDAGAALDAHVKELLARERRESIEVGYRITTSLLDSVQALVESENATMVVVLIPLAIQLDDQRVAAFAQKHNIEVSQLSMGAPQTRIMDWARRAGIPCIDLYEVLHDAQARGHEVYLAGDGHWTAEGHAITALRVAEELLRSGFLPRHAPTERQLPQPAHGVSLLKSPGNADSQGKRTGGGGGTPTAPPPLPEPSISEAGPIH